MICLDFDFQIDEFFLYCRSSQLRPKTLKSYEQTLRIFRSVPAPPWGAADTLA